MLLFAEIFQTRLPSRRLGSPLHQQETMITSLGRIESFDTAVLYDLGNHRSVARHLQMACDQIFGSHRKQGNSSIWMPIHQAADSSVTTGGDNAPQTDIDATTFDKFVKTATIRKHSYGKTFKPECANQLQQSPVALSGSRRGIPLNDHQIAGDSRGR